MQNETYEAPDSYAITNAQRRERNATAELRAEADYRSTRTRDFESEYAEADAFYAARPAPRVLSAAELEPYAAPNSYPFLKETR